MRAMVVRHLSSIHRCLCGQPSPSLPLVTRLASSLLAVVFWLGVSRLSVPMAICDCGYPTRALPGSALFCLFVPRRISYSTSTFVVLMPKFGPWLG